MKYYTYMLIDPRNNKPFYVGKGMGNRAYTHLEFKSGSTNPHKDNIITKLYSLDMKPIVEILEHYDSENDAYTAEAKLIETIGLENLSNIVPDARPPSKKNWTASDETRAKRSASLKGIERTDVWRKNLSDSKSGTNNPRYGIKEDPELTERRLLSMKRTKNEHKYELYKRALELINDGMSYGNVTKELGVGKGVCCALYNGTHGILDVFPELRELCRS